MNPHDRFDLVIEAGQSERHYWRDLWHYRELFVFLAWRDILVRYKRAVIGIAWAVVRPCMMMVVFTAIFGRLAKLPAGDVPYPILVFSALLPWQFFASALTEAGNSLVANSAMVSKVYFPRIIVPTSAVLVSLSDFLFSAMVLAGLMVWYGVFPDWRILTLPLFLLVAFCAALGAGLWIAALNVKYRDFFFIIPFVVQMGLYVSPVGFSSAIVPEEWRLIYSLNPMVGVIEGFRWAILGGDARIHWAGFSVSIAAVALLLLTGVLYFRRTEKTIVDYI
jgi:lipopolysaccharide transport system permease protein